MTFLSPIRCPLWLTNFSKLFPVIDRDMISGLTGTGTGTGTEIINLPGPGPGPGPIISILPGPGPGPGPTIQFDRDDRDDGIWPGWPGWPGPKPVFSYWKLHNLLLRLRGCLKMKFTMNESKNLKSQWMKLCKRSRSKSRQIWVIDRDRDRDRDQESWINRDRDRDRDEKCDLTGTGTGTGIAQNCQSQYRDSRYRESRSITDFSTCLKATFCHFTTFYHLFCLSNIFSCEHRKRLQINRGCLYYQEEKLLFWQLLPQIIS